MFADIYKTLTPSRKRSIQYLQKCLDDSTKSPHVTTMKKNIYLDYNATAPMLTEVKQMIVDVMECEGNPSSVHKSGREARKIVEDARVKVASLVGARARDVIFTSGGTESNNLAVLGTPTVSVVTSNTEHDSLLAATRAAGKPVYHVPVKENGHMDVHALRKVLEVAEMPALVSIMLANNETGIIQPVGELFALAKEFGCLTHMDAVQACGKMMVDRNIVNADYVSISSHKLGGPKGMGALILSPTAPLNAIIVGGGQELGRRSGTENVMGIAGFGVAAISAMGNLGDMDRQGDLQEYLESYIYKNAPDAIVVAHDDTLRVANTSCIILPGVSGETQVMNMDLNNVCISSGSACSSGKVKVSHVMKAMGYNDDLANSSIRVSIGRGTVKDDIDTFLKVWMAMYTRTANKRAS